MSTSHSDRCANWPCALDAGHVGPCSTSPEQRSSNELFQLRAKVANLEAGWSNCSQACARLQDERDAARKELAALRVVAERVRDHACAYRAPADSLLVKRELIGQLAQALGGSITERPPDEPSAAPIDSRGVVREPFVVKHYEGDTFPTIKGNGFDGLQVGEDRLEAEEFISWINARLSVPPAASRCLGAECHHTLCGTGANSTAPRWPLVEALREIAGYQGTLDTNAELMRKCAQETLDEYFVEYAEEILSEPPQPVTRAIVDLVTELRDAAQIAADGDTYTGSGIAAAKELIARADAFLRTAVTKGDAP